MAKTDRLTSPFGGSELDFVEREAVASSVEENDFWLKPVESHSAASVSEHCRPGRTVVRLLEAYGFEELGDYIVVRWAAEDSGAQLGLRVLAQPVQ